MNKKYKRVFVIVLDSLGIGAMKDSEKFGDVAVDTLGHIAESVEHLNIPNLQKMGIANLHPIKHVEKVEKPLGYYAALNEASVGKDTMTGHWEMMGLHIQKPFQTFTDTGFPKELIEELEKRCGRKVVGNKSASGTEILDEYGEHEIATGDMIVYTSADSVLQICGHEKYMGLDNLYKYCEIARELTMKDEWKVGRIIARPYVGEKKGEFVRTSNRHDYALKPFGRTVMNELQDGGYDVIALGKINDIFDGEGVTEAVRTKDNMDGMDKLIETVQRDFNGLSFLNLVDFDALYGHRRDKAGYAQAIKDFDERLPELMEHLQEDDLVIITADHGNDPTAEGTDHTREYIPVLMFSPKIGEYHELSVDTTFSSLGATIADNFNVKLPEYGRSYLKEMGIE